MLRKLFENIKKRPGLLFLIVILFLITIASIKPDFYLLGWDNYSSYFNLKTNIFRTLFATWRSYRGLGVPSDAEVTDVFRQLFFYILHFILPQQLLDQVYYMFALWVGILSTYFFASRILSYFHIDEKFKSEKWRDLFALFTFLFYLFNLNALSVFYSPIIPFINRFYTLPLLLLLFLQFHDSKHKIRDFIILSILVVLTSGSYLTPTVFITTFIALFLFWLFLFDFKKTVMYSMLFIFLNAFWLLPFLNYTIHKAPLIPLARTFIEINESTLNQPKANYALSKQSIFYPSFFDIGFPSINGARQDIYPFQNEFQQPIVQILLLGLPLLYGLGSILAIIFLKKNKKVLWIPAWIFLFLFLSMKEYSSFGFLYYWAAKVIPYFNVVFRIADTKFHAYISFAGSIAAAYALIFCFSLLRKRLVRNMFIILTGIFFISYGWLFRGYFMGYMINTLVYTKIPQAYFKIADKINKDPERVRVLQLPFDNWQSYWRSFSWGYIGSAFFDYFINKPYIDKTFEPASMENSYLHAKINNELESFYRSNNVYEKQQLSARFLDLLRLTGIKYVLVDQSITAEVYPRNYVYSAKQLMVYAQSMMQYLYENHQITNRSIYPISLNALYPDYRKLYPASINGLPKNLPAQTEIDLYEIDQVQQVFSFIPSTTAVDPKLNNLLETDADTLVDNHTIQTVTKPSKILPFMQQNHQPSIGKESVTLTYPGTRSPNVSYVVSAPLTNTDSYMIDVLGSKQGKNLTLSLYYRYYPDINGQVFRKYIGAISFKLPDIQSSQHSSYIMSDWSAENTNELLNAYRIQLNDTVLPIPSSISSQQTLIGSYMLHEKNIKAALLTNTIAQQLDLQTYNVPQTPCSIEGNNAAVTFGYCTQPSFIQLPTVFSKQIGNEINYMELGISTSGTAAIQAGNNSSNSNLLQQTMERYGAKPIHAYICAHLDGNTQCLNTHRNFQVFNGQTNYRISLQTFVSNEVPPVIDIGSLPFDDFEQSIKISKVTEYVYQSQQEQTLPFTPDFSQEVVRLNGSLQISFPTAISSDSYYHHPSYELFDNTLNPCPKTNLRNRITRFSQNTIFNYMENCNMTFAQLFQYGERYPYLLTYSYWLGSGQDPILNISNKSDSYLQERASLYQGYPHMKGMDQLNDPQLFDSPSDAAKQLKSIHLTTGSRLIGSRLPEENYSARASLNFSQDTANGGLVALGSLDAIEYPAAWQNLSLTPTGSIDTYVIPKNTFSYKSILPSLWKLNLENTIGTQSENQTKSMLLFDEGYDKQWKIYKGFWNMLIGREETDALECDGFANCFEIAPSSGNYYILYTPEKLSFLGWGLTFLAIGVTVFWLFKKPANLLKP